MSKASDRRKAHKGSFEIKRQQKMLADAMFLAARSKLTDEQIKRIYRMYGVK